jgi:hypothetical protein
LLTNKRIERLLGNEEAMERLRKNFYCLWKLLVKAITHPWWRRVFGG